MGKRGPKPKGRVSTKWTSNFAYAIGLITSDGNLSPDSRHIVFTSKDLEQIENYKKSLGLTCKIGQKSNGLGLEKKYYVAQFGDVLFYEFLESIGLHKNKSRTLNKLKIPDKYFFDFLRGLFDGDGCSYSYWDKRWKSSFMFYVSFTSASKKFVEWLRMKNDNLLKVKGHITSAHSKISKNVYFQLKYAKKEGLKIIKKMYKDKNSIYLNRKYLKLKKTLDIVGEHIN